MINLSWINYLILLFYFQFLYIIEQRIGNYFYQFEIKRYTGWMKDYNMIQSSSRL